MFQLVDYASVSQLSSITLWPELQVLHPTAASCDNQSADELLRKETSFFQCIVCFGEADTVHLVPEEE